MGIRYSFVDNAIYGTDDVNDIVGCLTGSGLAPFLSKDSYSVSDLNSVTAALTTDGADLDGCKCTAENVGTADMRVNISQGIIFFESGVRLIVDSEGYSIGVSPNTAGYVFAHYSPSLQIADIKFDSELPNDGEYVELAQLSADGVITGTRRFARSKVGTMGSNASQIIELTVQQPELYQKGTSENSYIVARAKGIAASDYNYAFIMEAGAENPYIASYMGLYKIDTQKFPVLINQGKVWYNCSNGGGFFRSTNSTYEGSRCFKVIDGELCLVVFAEERYASYINAGTYTAIFS